MATNNVNSGSVQNFTAPAGGVKSGLPVVYDQLVAVPLTDAKEGDVFAGAVDGTWRLAADAGLTVGKKCAWLNGKLVAPDTAGAVYFGKIVAESINGVADALLVP